MINEKNKDVMCAAPWSHLYIDTLGIVRPCSTSSEIYGDTHNMTINEAWNSNATQAFRKNLLDGVKQDGCKFCYQQEQYTGNSLRTGLNSMYGHLVSENITPELAVKSLHPGWSNLCNMACIMCGSDYSSLWYVDEDKLGYDMTDKTKFLDITPEVEKDIIDSLITTSLDRVYFAGGEPLITPYHYRVIDKIISTGIAKDISLRYSTNLSLLKYKSVDLTERWSHFKTVEVSASIDMIGDHAEYHRYGTVWKKISKNLHTVRYDVPNVKLAPTITVTALSIGYLPELLTYLIDELDFGKRNGDWIHSNLAMWPEQLNPHLLPKSIKEFYTSKLQSFLLHVDSNYSQEQTNLCTSVIVPCLDHMNEIDREKDFHTMTSYLEKLDKIRGHDWRSLWPEIASHAPTNNLKIELIDIGTTYE
jgi:MoaA/NifB/PqqE/SkfB family radical SAM enzyme|tara:strand:+ start:1770 stop:3023 length:1254 start_codon:yes stop_codon:yes gene_type:complete